MSPQRPPSDWIVPPAPFAGQINLVAYDPTWPAQYEAVAARIRAAIGSTAVVLEHAGSTSVPGLAAKNQIDVVLGVADSTDEAAYVPALEAAGFEFALREPEWFEHRLLRHEAPTVNLHVFPPRCIEVDRMLAFRDHLRVHEEDRRLYESTKAALSEREWPTVQDYADAKDDVVADIMSRIELP